MNIIKEYTLICISTCDVCIGGGACEMIHMLVHSSELKKLETCGSHLVPLTLPGITTFTPNSAPRTLK